MWWSKPEPICSLYIVKCSTRLIWYLLSVQLLCGIYYFFFCSLLVINNCINSHFRMQLIWLSWFESVVKIKLCLSAIFRNMNSIWHEWVFVDSCCGNVWKLVINNVSGLGFKKKWTIRFLICQCKCRYINFYNICWKKQSPWTENLH